MSAVWHVAARVRGAGAASAVFSLLDDMTGAVSAFEAGAEEWRLEAYPRSPVVTPQLAAQLALAAAGEGGVLVEIGEDRLPARDWVAENQLAFPPQPVGRFFIYGSHYRGGVPPGAVGIAVDAATAFGTGEHPSTRGCLRALDLLGRQHRFRKPLDVGTGTGILSIAAAKLLRRSVLASDIDPGAVNVARHNVARNGLAGLVKIRRAAGYRDRVLRKSRYDLIMSNILARPLALMAADLARALAPGGRAILSGLLQRQEPIVLAAHRCCGIFLDHRVVIDGWSTPVLHRAAMAMGAEAPIFEVGSVEGRLRPPSAGRGSRPSGGGSATRTDRAGAHHRSGPRFVSDESRYRQANGRRAPSAAHRPGPGAANRKRTFRPKEEG